MKKPIIGFTLDVEKPGGYSKFEWYAIRKNYLQAIEKLGGIAFPLSHNLKNVDDYGDMIDGLIITGGNFSISPKFFLKIALPKFLSFFAIFLLKFFSLI